MPRPILLAVLALLPLPAHAQDLVFSDATHAAGLTGSTTVGTASTGFVGGAGCGDFDRDGVQDLFIPMGPLTADRLMLNDGAGVFTDAAAAWGRAVLHMGSGMAVGDYDNERRWRTSTATCCPTGT